MKKFFVFLVLFFINFFVVNATNRFEVKFNSCIDGDTAKFIIDGDVKTVRFLSINTPEISQSGGNSEEYGEEASNYTCDALTNSSVIELQYDPKSDRKDKYNRVLAWVFVDGELLQKQLIREGLAEVKYVYDDYLYSNELKLLEEKAKDIGIGMWNNVDNSFDIFGPIIYTVLITIFIIIILYNKFTIKKNM